MSSKISKPKDFAHTRPRVTVDSLEEAMMYISLQMCALQFEYCLYDDPYFFDIVKYIDIKYTKPPQ